MSDDLMCKHGHYKHSCSDCESQNKWNSAYEIYSKVGVADLLIYSQKCESQIKELENELGVVKPVAEEAMKWLPRFNELEQENAELKRKLEFNEKGYALIHAQKDACDMRIEKLERIIAEMRAVDSPDFEKLKELGWTFSLCKICGESLSASKPIIQEGMVNVETFFESLPEWMGQNDTEGYVKMSELVKFATDYKAMLNTPKE